MIKVAHLSFSYGKEPFIEDMNFDVKKGEIFGFLGPSGAGKSTLSKIIIGLIPTSRSSVTVGGTESNRHGKDFYENIGVDFEFSTIHNKEKRIAFGRRTLHWLRPLPAGLSHEYHPNAKW